MGSLNASGIPVVTKDSNSYRKRDNLITVTDSVADVVSNQVSYKPQNHRTIGSGSIVREAADGGVEYTEERVWGIQYEAQSTDARIARDGARNLSVDNNDNETNAVIETSLQPNTPQEGVRHTGNRVVRSNTQSGTITDRVNNE